MSAVVLPFPLAARRDLVLRQAAWYCEQGYSAAEKNLRRQVDVQHQTMLRRGVDPAVAADECRSLEWAIRETARRFGGVA